MNRVLTDQLQVCLAQVLDGHKRTFTGTDGAPLRAFHVRERDTVRGKDPTRLYSLKSGSSRHAGRVGGRRGPPGLPNESTGTQEVPN